MEEQYKVNSMKLLQEHELVKNRLQEVIYLFIYLSLYYICINVIY